MATKEYFPHDYGARSKLVDVRKDYGLEGLGFYWCVVEILHEEGGYIKESRISGIAYDLRIETEKAEAIIRNYGLFVIKKGKIYAERVLRNLKKRAEISTARKQAANARWGNGYDTSEPPPDDEPQKKFDNNASDDEKKPISDEARRASLFYHFEDRTEKYFDNEIEWYKQWIADQFKEWRDGLKSLDSIDSSMVWDIEPRITNLIEAIENKKELKINGITVPTGKFLETLVYYFRGSDRHRELWEVIEGVDVKCGRGEVRNKQNYLISALYNTAKMNGG